MKVIKMSSLETSNVIMLERPTPHFEEETSEQQLRALAEQVRNHSRSSTKAIIATGVALRRAKRSLGHGKFRQWVVAECGFTMRTAQNYMRAAALADKSESVSLLDPAALHRVARPGTPPGVVDHVLERLNEGCALTEAEIIGLILESSQSEAEGAADPETMDDEHALRLARELHNRLGPDLVSRLIGSRWPSLRKHLRDTIEQPSKSQTHRAATPSDQV
jgi:hypothetical protein